MTENKSCGWCHDDWTDNFSVMDENVEQWTPLRLVKFCPFCGRSLREDREQDASK